MFDLLAGLTLGYLVGSFPSAVVVTRLAGRNIFEVGSGNMGAMNTARNVGWAAGSAVLLLDVAKGVIAVLLAQYLAVITGNSAAIQFTMPLAAGVGAVTGHAWSAFAGLKGGKALATTFGAALPIYPLAAFYTLLLLVALLLISRRTTLSAVAAIAAYPAIVMTVLARSNTEQGQAFAILTSVLLIAAIVIFKHLWHPAGRPAR
ncbi:MAG: glycerol-3-phosphate acyltransferase [Trueperaceae bacterium]